ncbi:MAG: ArsR family transcriptional regulator [Nitrososphaerota archaeon]|jgi:hypothetical protein|nr:ArsR family transcriptional regulator [Nitrososphaerota archaeon]
MPETELKGTTMKVYWFMLRTGHAVRQADIQKGLGLSTASLAQYHLRKLVEMGLVSEVQEGYRVDKVIVRSFFRVRNKLLPFRVFYVVFFSITFSALIVLEAIHPGTITSFQFIAIVGNAVALAASVYDALHTLRELP